MKLRTVLIDDERNNLDNLRQLLTTYCPELIISGEAMSADEGIELIRSVEPHLVFLDIQMPGKTGFDMLKELNRQDFTVIFVTAFEKFAIEALRFSALDYLLKPISIKELQEAVAKAIHKHEQHDKNRNLENLVAYLMQQNQRENHRIALSTQKETRFVRPQEIIRCESSNNYTTVYLTDGGKLLVSKGIYEFEEMLREYGFIRCHQSHLVNKEQVKSWIKVDGESLLLYNNDMIPVSKNKRIEVKNMISGK
ncbi:MAG TPA: LytTR family DNA-binding domain-containing protein [Chitinophagaceae bacterium]|nr:LytTR family DNA-binding domain-containing protein [Chitinophagaceae bacterium]